MTTPVHRLTLSRGGRAESDFGQQRASKQNYVRESVQKVARKTDGVNKVNKGPRYKKTTSDRRTSINTKKLKYELCPEAKGMEL